MPFYGQDWRAPGETWVRLGDTANWERAKLRPIQIASTSDSPLGLAICEDRLKRHSSSASFSSTDDNIVSSMFGTSPSSISIPRSESEDSSNEDDLWQPHCFVKTNRSKEFIGCTSMSEAFHRLDLARAVVDVRRFNYVCKVVQILVTDKLQNLSASARKHLLAIIQSIVINSVEQDVHVTTARDLVTRFGTGLEGHVYGSPTLVSRQLDVVSNLVDSLVGMIADHGMKMLSDSSEESLTFLDLPKEVLSEILKRVDHVSILECAKAHEVLNALVTHESRLWKSLANFHFTKEQIEKHNKPESNWRHIFFELKKYYGLREVYADMINICCHCKALFWKDIGHPCVSTEAPSVRVTPLQFVQMLNEL